VTRAPNNAEAAGNQRFTRANRLTKPAEFRATFDQGRRTADHYASVFVASNELAVARLGLAVSKRVARHAVRRNRIKRLIRETFRHQQHRLTGKDVVVVAKASSATANAAQLRHALEELLLAAAQKVPRKLQ
jgi:ribonuclease P protein component